MSIDVKCPKCGGEAEAPDRAAGKNGWALAAYYCGVLSVIPCLGLLLGPIALVLGVKGRYYAIAYPRARWAGRAWAGIILGLLTSLVNYGSVILIWIGTLGSLHERELFGSL